MRLFWELNFYAGPQGGNPNWRLMNDSDLMKVRSWGQNAIDWEVAESRLLRQRLSGFVLISLVTLIGAWWLDWGPKTVFLFWYVDVLGIWLGDCLRLRSCRTDFDFACARARESFLVSVMVRRLMLHHTGKRDGPPMAQKRAEDKDLKAVEQLKASALLLVPGLLFLLMVDLQDWQTITILAATLLWHLLAAWRLARSALPDEQLPAVLPQSGLPIMIAFWAFMTVIIIVRAHESAGDRFPGFLESGFVVLYLFVYLAIALTGFLMLNRFSKRRLREMRHYLSLSKTEQQKALEPVQERSSA